jgi:hypothetical protein
MRTDPAGLQRNGESSRTLWRTGPRGAEGHLRTYELQGQVRLSMVFICVLSQFQYMRKGFYSHFIKSSLAARVQAVLLDRTGLSSSRPGCWTPARHMSTMWVTSGWRTTSHACQAANGNAFMLSTRSASIRPLNWVFGRPDPRRRG